MSELAVTLETTDSRKNVGVVLFRFQNNPDHSAVRQKLIEFFKYVADDTSLQMLDRDPIKSILVDFRAGGDVSIALPVVRRTPPSGSPPVLPPDRNRECLLQVRTWLREHGQAPATDTDPSSYVNALENLDQIWRGKCNELENNARTLQLLVDEIGQALLQLGKRTPEPRDYAAAIINLANSYNLVTTDLEYARLQCEEKVTEMEADLKNQWEQNRQLDSKLQVLQEKLRNDRLGNVLDGDEPENQSFDRRSPQPGEGRI